MGRFMPFEADYAQAAAGQPGDENSTSSGGKVAGPVAKQVLDYLIATDGSNASYLLPVSSFGQTETIIDSRGGSSGSSPSRTRTAFHPATSPLMIDSTEAPVIAAGEKWWAPPHVKYSYASSCTWKTPRSRHSAFTARRSTSGRGFLA